MRILGRHLFEMLFRGDIEKAYTKYTNAADVEQSRLRLELSFENPDIQNWPWEYLCDDERDFLALDTRLTLTRRVHHRDETPLNPDKKRPLNVLLVAVTELPTQAAIFSDGAEADFQATIERAINVVERPLYPLQLHTLFEPTAETLLQKLDELKLAGQSPDVVHIISHCRYQEGNGEIALHRGNTDSVDWCNVKRLASCFGQKGANPRLLFLQGAVSESAIEAGTTYKIFTDWAETLNANGTPALVAMPFEKGSPDSMFGGHATFFAESFYKNLARGVSVDVAVQDGRLTLHNLQHDDGRLFGAPIIYLQSADADLTLPPQPQSLQPQSAQAQSAQPQSFESRSAQSRSAQLGENRDATPSQAPSADPNRKSRNQDLRTQPALPSEQPADDSAIQTIIQAGEKRLLVLQIAPAEREALQQKLADLEHLLPTIPETELKQFLLDYGYYEDRFTKLVILAMSQAASVTGGQP